MNPQKQSTSPIHEYLRARKFEIEEALWDRMPEAEGIAAKLNEAMRYPLQSGGKRIRPILVLIGADFCRGVSGRDAFAGNTWESVAPDLKHAIYSVACAIEVVHTYSLIHDDLPCMDDDDLRRGKPTSHVMYGEAMAVLSADALHTLGFQLICSVNEKYALQAFRAAHDLAVACGYPGMVAGQVVDLDYEHKQGSKEVLEYIHTHKTAALIRAGLLMGAHMVSDNEKDRQILYEIGGKLGLIFQVVDDILDVIGDTELMGKTAGSDQAHEKLTYPSLIGLESSYQYVENLRRDIMNLLEPEGERAEILIELTNALADRKA